MTKLKLKQIDNFKFLEDGHTYELGGKLLTGVTTILQVRAKDFLKWWTVKLMWENLTGKIEDIKKMNEVEYEELILNAKKAHTVKSKEALVSGTIAHNWIEEYIKGKIEGQDVSDKQFPEDLNAANSIHIFLDWEGQHEVEWLASEVVLPSILNLFAGTIDFVAKIDGVMTLGDFKTSNQISEDVALQTAAYSILLDENLLEGEERPTQRVVLRIPKAGMEFEYQRIDTELEFDKQIFLHLREIHRWNLYIENNFKVEAKVKLQKNG